MRQILQNLKTGETILADVPAPAASRGHVLVRTRCSLLSVGTERMLIDFGRGSLIDKARQQPEKVRQVVDKVKVDGLLPTFEAIQSKLETLVPMGYCNAGIVLDVGEGVEGLAAGDRVISNGPHAEVVLVPHRLTAKIPDSVPDETAAWTVLGAIGLQGIRLVAPTLGETIAVTGLGPIGLLCVQMLRAQACDVLAIDLDPDRCALARGFGATSVCISQGEDPVAAAMTMTGGRGIDGVLLTASTRSNEPVKQAAAMSRQRGRIVLVGVAGLQLDRADFYKKELSFQVSCSYGPGRYDPAYEQRGNDYPLAFVRWTEQRNFEAVLRLMGSGALEVGSLITHRAGFGDAPRLYGRIGEGEKVLGALLTYPTPDEVPDEAVAARTVNAGEGGSWTAGAGVLGVFGAGNFASRKLIPLLAKMPVRLRTISSQGGTSAGQVGRKFAFERSTTDPDEIWGDRSIDAVLVATRHDSHARLVAEALRTGRAIYVEKPLAVTREQLDQVRSAWTGAETPRLMVGFNRRFSPHAVKMRELLAPVREPKSFVVTVNAGAVPPDSWVHDPVTGGGRIVGEACHFIDLLRYLAGSPITSWTVTTLGAGGGLAVTEDKTSFSLRFADGSFGVVHYLGNGSKAFPKERVEVFCAGRVLQLNDFKSLKGWSWPGFRSMNLRRQDKGHAAALGLFIEALRRGGASPVPWEEVEEVSEVSIAVAELARSGGGISTAEAWGAPYRK